MSTDLLVVVPTYKEADNIAPLLDRVFASMPNANVLFVDDKSPDQTVERIKDYQGRRPGQIHLLERSGKLGLGTAYVAGFSWGLERGFKALVQMDADLSHDPAYLPRMMELLSEHDAVFGSRYVAGGGTQDWSWLRKLISRTGSLYARLILGIPFRDLTGGFNAWRDSVLSKVRLDEVQSVGYAFQIELKYRAWLADFRLAEMPIVFTDRRIGQSKMSGHTITEAIGRVWRLRPLKHKKLTSPVQSGSRL